MEICKGQMSACRCSICDMKYALWKESTRDFLEDQARRDAYSDRVIKELNRRKSR